MTSWTVTTRVTGTFRLLAGTAATGRAEFLGGRAGFPVTRRARVMLMLLAACAGVFAGIVLVID